MELSDASFEAARGATFNSALLKAFVLLLLALCLATSASAKYSLEGAETNITVNASGIAHVEESVSYAFDGKYIDIHKELKVLPGESIQNVEGNCSDNACKLRVEPIPEGYRLIGELPDPTPEKLTLFVSYDFYGAVKVHRDVSEFSFKLWGGGWEKPLKSFKGNVTLPVKNENESEIRYWTHPVAYTQEVNIENSSINLRAGEIPSTQWYEIRVVFPKIESPNPGLVQIDDADGLEKILATESEYQRKDLLLKSFHSMTILIALFILAFPFLIYYIYGREPKIDYEVMPEMGIPVNFKSVDFKSIDSKPADFKSADFKSVDFKPVDFKSIDSKPADFKPVDSKPIDSKPADFKPVDSKPIDSKPIDSKPVVVNAIMKGRMGIPTIDGFTATVMDLANRGYISLRDLKPEEKDSSFIPEAGSRDFMVELPNNEVYLEAEGSLSELEDFEKDVLCLLSAHASDRKVSWKKLEKKLESGTDSYQFLIAWSKKVQAYTEFNKFFQSTGIMYIYRFARAILLAAIVYYIAISRYFPSDEFPLASKINVLTALIGILGFVMARHSNIFMAVFGRWTPEGSLYYKRWDNFRKYITDLPALKVHSPESIEIWDSYLVYAISLGVAKEFLQNISLIVPSEQLKKSRFYPVIYNYSQPGDYYQSDCDSEVTCSSSLRKQQGLRRIQKRHRWQLSRARTHCRIKYSR